MSSTISTFLNAIPASAPEYSLAQTILNKITLAASTTNPTHANSAKGEIPSLLQQLMGSLISRGRLPVCTLLALAASAGTLAGSGYNLPDTGVTGTVSGTLTITAGAY